MTRNLTIKNKTIGEGRPKVCVPLVGRTEEEILKQADQLCNMAGETNIDMAEFRGDYFEGVTDKTRLLALLRNLRDKLRDIILLFTIRSEAEGGEAIDAANGGQIKVNALNRIVIESGIPDMVDIELFSGADEVRELITLAHEKGIHVILSNHDFKTTPEADVIVNRLRSMQDMGADIAKIAVMPQNKMHMLALLAACCTMKEKYAGIPIVAISMGSLGGLSRVCGQIFGSSVTFASMEQASAPGQIPVNDLNLLMELIGRYCV